MAKLVLDSKKVECLEVVIDGKSYNIPLGSNWSQKELKKLTEEDVQKHIEAHLWEGALEELPASFLKQIYDMWGEETAQAMGASLGKS